MKNYLHFRALLVLSCLNSLFGTIDAWPDNYIINADGLNPKKVPDQQADSIEELYKRAIAYKEEGNFDKALNLFYQCIQLNPHLAAPYYHIGCIYAQQHELDKAIEYFKKTITIKPNAKKAIDELRRAYALLGDYENAWKQCKEMLRLDNKNTPIDAWANLDIFNKTILIRDNRGFGDLFQYIRFAKAFKEKGARIICQIRSNLKPMLSLCDYIDQLVVNDQDLPPYDLDISTWFFENVSPDLYPVQIPYLVPDVQLVKHWGKKLADDKHFKIGLCWQANYYADLSTGKLVTDNRSIPLVKLIQLASLPSISLYSLQKENGMGQIKALPEPTMLHTFDNDFDVTHGKFMDTAAAMKNLDLVITVDTSIAHLAGALGVPTWVLLPISAEHRWLINRSDSPWYPTMRLFRQSKSNDWESVIETIINELKNVLQNNPL